MSPSRASTAMVLSGGGAYGAYEVGVLLALCRGESPATGGVPLDAKTFAGTSVGAYNAAAMVAGAGQGLARSAERLYRIWLDEIARQPNGCDNGIYRIRGGAFLEPECLLRPTTYANLFRDGVYFLRGVVPAAQRFAQVARPLGPDALSRAILEQLDVSALFDMTPFENLLRSTISLDDLLAAGLALRIVSTNFTAGEVSVFTEQDIATRVGHAAVIASAAIPGFFPPVEIDGMIHVDGGALVNTPLLPVIRENDTIHVAYMSPPLSDISVDALRSTVTVVDRMIVTGFAASMNEDLQIIGEFNRTLRQSQSPELAPPTAAQWDPVDRATAAVGQWVRANSVFTPTTVHRYYPADDLGGSLGFLDFSYNQVASLIDRGYQDAVAHDCAASGCVIRGEPVGPPAGGRP